MGLPGQPDGRQQAWADEDPRPSMPWPPVPLPVTVGVPWHRAAQAQRRHDDVGPYPCPPDAPGHPFPFGHRCACVPGVYPDVARCDQSRVMKVDRGLEHRLMGASPTWPSREAQAGVCRARVRPDGDHGGLGERGTTERDPSHHWVMKSMKNPRHPGAHPPSPHAHLCLTIRKGREEGAARRRCPDAYAASAVRSCPSGPWDARRDRINGTPSSSHEPCPGSPCALCRGERWDRDCLDHATAVSTA
jgi:hypothetical protein